ncbi:type 2 isopentenyl-diphosphate Delta-isomerase [Candidatus Woesearchaeota archaeon]|nr:type 2 isopentenyl-diphosphate Delta-isomerase [Candidatus Woesearchaeota archaeon]
MESRKNEHIKISLNENIEFGKNGFENYRFIINSLPEISFEDIDTGTEFLDKKISAPIILSSITGGSSYKKINENLAKAAQSLKIAVSVGSERVLLENKKFIDEFNIRKYCSNVPLIGNLGAVQLNYGFSAEDCRKAVELIDADALYLHLNPLQEALQKTGQTNFRGLVKKIGKVNKELDYPLMIKEVGTGISGNVGERLKKIGIKYLDVAGYGGTNFASIESMRKGIYDTPFSELGIPTAESIEANKDLGFFLIASGGIRNGLEIAKAICLGADLCGIALPVLKPATISSFEVEKTIKKIINELKITMFSLGVKNIDELKNCRLLKKQD